MDASTTSNTGSSHLTPGRIAAALVLIAAVVLVALYVPVRPYLVALLDWVQGLGVWGMVVVGIVYVIATIAFVPGTLVTLGAGYAFGVVWGTVVVSISSTVGAALSFLVGRYLARDLVQEKIEEHPKFQALDNALEEETFKVVFLLRLVPLLPFNALNYAFGLSKVSFGRYVLASWIGMFPATVMYVYFGSLAEKVTRLAAAKPDDQVPIWAIGETVRRIASGDFGGGVLQNAFYWLGFVAAVSVAWIVTRRARAELERLTQREAGGGEPASGAANSAEPPPSPPPLEPDDEANRALADETHPSSWTNPTVDERYNFVAVGGGTAGLVGAAAAAGLGARTALVERAYLGGDCLVTGCVPSKALLRCARAAADARRADEFGVRIDGDISVDFEAVMRRMRRIRAHIGEEDSAQRFTDLGVDVHLGHARFIDEQTLEVDGARIQFARALVATGGEPFVPPIDGLEETDYLTNETVFSLTELPDRLAVVGGGPIGCELAQAFERFGADVSVIEMTDQVLGKEDGEAAELVERALREDGVDIHLETEVVAVREEDGEKVLTLEGEGPAEITADELLLAVGRSPNVAGLNLEAAGVDYDPRAGVVVDGGLQTTNRRIYAAGDVASPYKFTHVADAQARLAVRNALFFGRAEADALTIPWATYTDPEVAHVGLYPDEARERGLEVETTRQDLSGVHRALLDGASEGFLKILRRAGSGEILGATLVAPHAGDLISEITLAMEGDLGLETIADTIHPYPTVSAAAKRAADKYNRTRLKSWMKSLLETWFRWRR